MESINFVLCIIYLILGVLNILGFLTIEDSSVFGMTVGALFLCIAPLIKKKQIRVIMYIGSAFCILGFPMMNKSNEYIKGIDSNTWLLLSLAVTFLANYLGKVDLKKIEDENKEKELKERSVNIELLKKEIEKMRKNNKQ